MTAGLCLRPTPGIGCTDLAGIGELLLRTATEEPGAAAVVLQGPGGTGKSVLLADLAEAHRRAGRAVTNARTAPDPATLDGELAVLVDDAHRLTEGAAHRLRDLAAHPSVRLVIACRPWPRPAALLDLMEALGGHRRLIVLGHLDRGGVAGLAGERLGADATPALVDVVHHQTGGLPALVHAVLRWLEERTARFGPGPALGWLAPGQPARMVVPDEVLDRVRANVAMLDDDARTLLHAVALGAPLDPRLLGDLLGIQTALSADLIEETRASGLLLGNGQVIPLASWVLLSATPADVSRHRRQRLLELLVERGDEPLQLARALAADGVRNPHAARVLERHGDAALRDDPTLAAELLGEAVASGASVRGLAARRAHAEALAGHLDTALQWADTVLPDRDAPDRSLAAGVSAAVLAQRGLLTRSAALYRLAGPERAGSAALALVATGFPAEAAAALEEPGSGPVRGLPTLLSGSEELVAQGILQSVRAGPDAQADTAAALSTLTRAAALLEPVGRTALLLDTPAALGALVALHSGELGMAESVLTRALAADVGGAPGRPRHLLLRAWVEMLRGHSARARASMSEAVTAAQQRVEPRDELFLRALEVGLARRNSDSTGLSGAWSRAREALLRYPVDLFTLLPLGELVIAGARVKDSDHLKPHVAAAQALLARLGDPPLWSTSLHWSAAQAAIVADDPVGLRPHAAALVGASRTSPYAATLARAGRCWLRVLTGDVDAAAVTASAGQLAAIGLSWDGSRLAGQAAARAVEPRDRTVLLTCARALTVACGTHSGAAACASPDQSAPQDLPSGQLSDREREVARLVIDGQTYREIGGRLFISAKTVEHHVSRMRQRLGASNRSDLLTRLRAELSVGA